MQRRSAFLCQVQTSRQTRSIRIAPKNFKFDTMACVLPSFRGLPAVGWLKRTPIYLQKHENSTFNFESGAEPKREERLLVPKPVAAEKFQETLKEIDPDPIDIMSESLENSSPAEDEPQQSTVENGCSTLSSSVAEQPPESNVIVSVKQGGTQFFFDAERRTFFLKKAPSLQMKILDQFLPEQSTVREGFYHFFYCTAICCVCTFFSMSIATRTLLQSFFVDSSPGVWLLKDLLPAMLTAVTANAIFSYDHRPRFWFLTATFLTHTAIFAEFWIPTLLPSTLFLPAAIITSFLKGSAMLMFGVTRATILQHFAKRQNVGELTKQMQSVQMMLYTMFGALGLLFASLAPPLVQTVAVCVSFAAGMTYTKKAVEEIHFTLLTPAIFAQQCAEFLKSHRGDEGAKLLTPKEMSTLTGFWGDPPNLPKSFGWVCVSPKLSHVQFPSHAAQAAAFHWTPPTQHASEMMIPVSVRECLREHGAYIGPAYVKGLPRVIVLLEKKCSPETIFSAVLAAYELVDGIADEAQIIHLRPFEDDDDEEEVEEKVHDMLPCKERRKLLIPTEEEGSAPANRVSGQQASGEHTCWAPWEAALSRGHMFREGLKATGWNVEEHRIDEPRQRLVIEWENKPES